MSRSEAYRVEGREVAVTRLDKILFPEIGAAKAEVIDYYVRMAPCILPYLRDRPFSMLHFPDGVHGKSFYRKRRPGDAPGWLRGVSLPSGEKTIDWCLVNDLPSLIYMANRSCIETHAWFSRMPDIDRPDVAVFDLDPPGNAGFGDAVAAALLVGEALDALGLRGFPKLSGKTGVHVIVPIEPVPYGEAREFVKTVCRSVERAQPGRFTTERAVARRGGRVYLDAVQNGRGKTLPSPYSLRAVPGAHVSAPVTWEELRGGVTPDRFTLRTMRARMEAAGDLFAPVYALRQRLPQAADRSR